MQSLPIHLKIWATGHLNEEVIEVDESRIKNGVAQHKTLSTNPPHLNKTLSQQPQQNI